MFLYGYNFLHVMSCFARVIKLILRLLIVHQCNVEQLKHKNIAWSFKFTTFLLKGQPGNILTYQLMPKLIVEKLLNCKNFNGLNTND